MPDDKSITPHLGPRVERLEQRADSIDSRLRKVEQTTGENRAMRKERDERIFQKIEALETQIKKLENHLIWPIRILIGVLLTGLGTFIIQGGLVK